MRDNLAKDVTDKVQVRACQMEVGTNNYIQKRSLNSHDIIKSGSSDFNNILQKPD